MRSFIIKKSWSYLAFLIPFKKKVLQVFLWAKRQDLDVPFGKLISAGFIAHEAN
jgi:hypothetical protein